MGVSRMYQSAAYRQVQRLTVRTHTVLEPGERCAIGVQSRHRVLDVLDDDRGAADALTLNVDSSALLKRCRKGLRQGSSRDPARIRPAPAADR